MIAFFLGAHPEVSLAELRLIFNTTETVHLSTLALFDIDLETADREFPLLGGVPRYGVVVETLEKGPEFQAKLVQGVINELKDLPKKEYVLTLSGVKFDKKSIHRAVKELLPKAKYDGSFGEDQHTPATVFHVINRGGSEFVLTPHQGNYLFIKTVQVQDPKHWSILDIERPGRDMRIGMLPAKLARIMVNLSGVNRDGRLWDPFVGQATIAMHAAMMGIPVYGTDISRKSLEKGKQNMAWAINNKFAKHGLVNLKVMPIEQADTSVSVTAIATEPFLGTPHFKPFSGEFLASREWRSVERLYVSLLHAAGKALHKGDRFVFIKPVFAFVAGREIKWYNPALSIPADSWKVPEIIKDLGPLMWVQRDSVVGREIVILEKR